MAINDKIKKFLINNKELIDQDVVDPDLFVEASRKLTPNETIEMVEMFEKIGVIMNLPSFIKFIRKVIGRNATFVGIDDDDEEIKDFQDPYLNRKCKIISLDMLDSYDEAASDQDNFDNNSYWLLKFLDNGEELEEIPGIALELDKKL